MAVVAKSEPRNLKEPAPDCYENAFFEFMIQHCQEDLKKILKNPNADDHFGLLINFVELNVSCSRICNVLLRDPDKILPEGDKAGLRALLHIYENSSDNRELIIKRFVHVRIHSMPSCWDRYKTTFPGCKEIGNFFTIVGTVVRTKAPKILEFCEGYKCNKCKQMTLVEAAASRYHAFPKGGEKCPNLCVGGKLEPIEGDADIDKSARLKDYQEIKLQEQSKLIDELPKAMCVALENDLVNACKPGDDVIVTGKLFLRWQPFRINQPLAPDFVFLANHVQVNNDQKAAIVFTDETIRTYKEFWDQYEDNPFEARKLILKSFCPEVYGMYLVKLAMFVVLAGGVRKVKSASAIRGESHLLLVGDPGTGKSQLLKYVTQLCPRSIMTTGAGTTTAGLTVSAVKDGGEWHLEAGSLVLADGGVCCIDEFSTIKEHDRVSIHEAMEQQSISVAKGGMVCTLATKCTIIAACNPKLTKYDPSEDIEVNIGLSTPLLSRFDLIIVLKDIESETWDEYLCDFVLHNAMKPIKTKSKQTSNGLWDSDKLQSYLVLIKDKKPTMTDDAIRVMNEYYQRQRNSTNRNVARTTARMFESLVRLSEGHARLMYRDFVLIHDAITAVSLIEASMQTSSLASMANPLHISFPEDPLQEYYNQARLLLETLGLPDLWAVEKVYLENFMKNPKKGTPTSPAPPPPRSIKAADPQPTMNSSFDILETQSSHFVNSGSQQESKDIVPGSQSSQLNSSFRDVHISSYNADEDLFPADEFFSDSETSSKPQPMPPSSAVSSLKTEVIVNMNNSDTVESLTSDCPETILRTENKDEVNVHESQSRETKCPKRKRNSVETERDEQPNVSVDRSDFAESSRRRRELAASILSKFRRDDDET